MFTELRKKARIRATDAATKGAYVLGEIPTLVNFGVGWAQEAWQRGPKLDRATLERLTAHRIVRQSLRSDELAYFRRVVESRSLSDWALPLSFFRLPNQLEKKFLGAFALELHHAARLALVQKHLPPAEKILDLGGATEEHREGALLGMGYPHHPKKVTVVDLPREERYHSDKKDPRDFTTKDGTEVQYVYSSMSELEPFRDSSFDLVWSGQSIEHVTEEEADRTIQEAHRVLKKGGNFCLDTPNRRMTRLISERFLHHDHKIEYVPRQLAGKLEKHGFKVEEMKSVTPLPISSRLGRLSKLEILNEARVGDDYDNGLSFYLRARKA